METIDEATTSESTTGDTTKTLMLQITISNAKSEFAGAKKGEGDLPLPMSGMFIIRNKFKWEELSVNYIVALNISAFAMLRSR